MFVPIILGSDKTTVSVGTGNNEYYPLYLSIGNIRNNVRRAHRNGVVLVGFLAIPKSKPYLILLQNFLHIFFAAEKKYANDAKFRKFRRQLYHSSLAHILESLKPGMTTPEVVRCPDGHYRRAVYGLGPYIADYPEQALLACIVQGWCPKSVPFMLLTMTFTNENASDVLSHWVTLRVKVYVDVESILMH